MGKLTGIPCFSSGNADLDRAFRLALDTLSANTKPVQTGLLSEPCPCLTAGQDYPSPWTRDAATGECTVSVTIPKGSDAELHLPDGKTVTVASGDHSISSQLVR